MKKLIIFDLDGTLIRNLSTDVINSRQRLSFALHEVFDVEYVPTTSPGGMTDTSIFIYIAEKRGISKEKVKKQLNRLYKAEVRYAERHIKESKIRKFKGVTRVLDRLLKEGHVITVATGNIAPVAKIKLKKVGLIRYFEYFKHGGFGTVMKREDLIKEAIRQAERKHGKFGKENMFYFGDTRGDVMGGKIAKVRTVGVATGRETIDELKTANPDYLLKDLTNSRRVMAIINS